MKKVLIPIANGTEDMELVIIADILRRAGCELIIAGLDNECVCARKIKIIPDTLLQLIDSNTKFDIIILPGGLMGVNNLKNSEILKQIILNNLENIYLGAICAAPLILKEFGILRDNTKLTSHPSIETEFNPKNYSNEKIVIHNNIITSRGAGTAIDFSLILVELLFDKVLAKKIANDIVYNK